MGRVAEPNPYRFKFKPYIVPSKNPDIIIGSKMTQRVINNEFQLPNGFDCFKKVIISTDQTIREKDLERLKEALEKFKESEFPSLKDWNAPKVRVTFSRGRYSEYNEIIVKIKTIPGALKDMEAYMDIILVSNQPDRVGRSDE